MAKMTENVDNCTLQPQAFDVSGVSEYTVAYNMVRNRIFYIEIRSIEKLFGTSYLTIENTVSDHL